MAEVAVDAVEEVVAEVVVAKVVPEAAAEVVAEVVAEDLGEGVEGLTENSSGAPLRPSRRQSHLRGNAYDQKTSLR